MASKRPVNPTKQSHWKNQQKPCYWNFKTPFFFGRMGFSRVASLMSRVSLSPLYSGAFFHLVPIASVPLSFRPLSSIATAVSASQAQDASTPSFPKTSQNRWKPMCLYYTQGKCTMVEVSSKTNIITLSLRLLAHVKFVLFVFLSFWVSENLLLFWNDR